jgi:hypothetical protein
MTACGGKRQNSKVPKVKETRNMKQILVLSPSVCDLESGVWRFSLDA